MIDTNISTITLNQIKASRRLLKLGNSSAYQQSMINNIRGSLSEETKEVLIKAGKKDGYSFRQYGLRL